MREIFLEFAYLYSLKIELLEKIFEVIQQRAILLFYLFILISFFIRISSILFFFFFSIIRLYFERHRIIKRCP